MAEIDYDALVQITSFFSDWITGPLSPHGEVYLFNTLNGKRQGFEGAYFLCEDDCDPWS